ncbi:MAG: RraA family protein [Actinobacteria bacterium]|nr:RraA family protein [Actinomycetota bacterium]
MIESVTRPSPDLVERLRAYRSSDLSDAMNRAQTVVGIRPIYTPIDRVVGPAITVNSVVPSIDAGKMALAASRAGDVLVVTAPFSTGHAVWGGNLAFGTKSRGIAGLIVDGSVRDVSEIRAVGLPTFARDIATAAAPVHSPQGEVNVPVACGGVVVFPGDIVVADEDGIVVIPPAYVEKVIEDADTVLEKARSVQEILARGDITNLEGIRARYQEEGFVSD